MSKRRKSYRKSYRRKSQTSKKKRKVSKKSGKNAYNRRYFLNLIGNANTNRRKFLIDIADKGEINAICECADNLLKGNITISNAQKKKLSKYKKYMRFIAQKRTSIKKRKTALKQHGGFLPMLIPAALSVLSSLIGR